MVLRADAAAVREATAAASQGAPQLVLEARGAAAVAQVFTGRAQAAQPALVDGLPGLVWAQDGNVRTVFDLLVSDGRISVIEMLADPAVIRQLTIQPL